MADLVKSLADSAAIVKRAREIEEDLRRGRPLNADFAEGWQQRYLERQDQRYENALEMARQEAEQAQLPAGELTEDEWRSAAAEDKSARANGSSETDATDPR